MLKKWANPNDCNEAILFLLDSNKHGHMMKANIFIDGGYLSKEIYFFIGLILVSFIFNHACFLFLYKLIELDYRTCKVAAMIVTTILNYKAKRHIVFLNSNI